MHFLKENIEEYSLNHTQKESELLYQLNRETHQKVLNPRMLSGHMQGRVLSMISKLHRPKKILEIGTYTGYSALCLAEGLVEGGKLYTIDINEELSDMVQSYVSKAGFNDKIEIIIGNAIDKIKDVEDGLDIVFIDADKENYINYYEAVLPKLNKGGLIIADNVLWSGKVLKENDNLDIDTKILKQFNELVTNDDRVENVLLPVRDGLMLALKK